LSYFYPKSISESIKCDNLKVIHRGKNESMKLPVLIIFALTIIITPAFAELDLSNQKIVSLDGKLLLEFGENIQTFKRGYLIETPQLENGIIKLTDRTVFLGGEYTNILGNSFSVRLDDGKIYAKNNQDGTFTVKVLTVSDSGFQKQTFSSILQPIEIIESPEIIEPTEKTDTLLTEPKVEQYIPDLMMTSSHDFKTFWQETFNVDVQAFDGNINSNPEQYPFQGRIDGVDVKVLLSLDNVQLATLSGVTANNGHWDGEYFFKENISAPGEYVVDVIISYLGETVSKSSTMFIIAATTSGGSSNHAPIANAGTDDTTPNNNPISLDGSGSSDPDGDAFTFSWVKLSGPAGTFTDTSTATPDYTPTGGAGDAVFQLTVTDSKGASSSDSVTITVT